MRIIPAWVWKKYARLERLPAADIDATASAKASRARRSSDVRGPPAAGFCQEGWYRFAYPDADRAIRRGDFGSCIDHYRHVARTHAYSPSPLFDEVWYRRRYPEAARAVQSGEAQSGLDHYLSAGASLGFLPCPYFDADWYAAVNPDLTEGTWSATSSSLFAHFVLLVLHTAQLFVHDALLPHEFLRDGFNPFGQVFARFLELPLPDTAKRAILWDNCARYYGLAE